MRSLRICGRFNRLATNGGTLHKQSTSFGFSTAAVKEEADSEIPVVEDEKKKIDGLFPWRSMPPLPQLSMTEYLTHSTCSIFVNEIYLNGESQISPRSSYMEMDFIVGAQQAFQSSVHSIFNHKQIRAAQILAKQISREESTSNDDEAGECVGSDEVAKFVETLEKSAVTEKKDDTVESATLKSDPVASSGKESEVSDKQKVADLKEEKQDLKDLHNDAHFVPDLQGIFDSKLADFYESAISQIQKPNIKIFHKIERVGTPVIENYDILFGGKRGIDLTGLMRRRFLGIIPQMGLVEKTTTNFVAFDERKVSKSRDNLIEGRRFATVRLLLSIPLTETFYVEDTSTNTLLQGTKEVQTNKHSVLFETVLHSQNTLELDWTICDIDNWLDGNEFWQPTKVKKTK